MDTKQIQQIPQFNQLFDMFNLAKGKLKYPKLNFILSGQNVQLYLATKGYIAIKINGEYVGKLETDRNSFRLYQHTELAVPLMAWCKEPKQSAKIYGIAYRHCCFCNTELTTKQSVFAGYGPICAENFGLPWGETGEPIEESEPLVSLGTDLDIIDTIADNAPGMYEIRFSVGPNQLVVAVTERVAAQQLWDHLSTKYHMQSTKP